MEKEIEHTQIKTREVVYNFLVDFTMKPKPSG